MSDGRSRELERAAQHGDPAASAALLRERLRVGAVTEERLRLEAYLGDDAARLALGAVAPAVPTDIGEWVAGLRDWGRRPVAHAAWALARAALPVLAEEGADEQFRAIVDAAEAWLRAPTGPRARCFEDPVLTEGLGRLPGPRPAGWSVRRWTAHCCMEDAMTTMWDVACGGEGLEPASSASECALAASEILPIGEVRAVVARELLEHPEALTDPDGLAP